MDFCKGAALGIVAGMAVAFAISMSPDGKKNIRRMKRGVGRTMKAVGSVIDSLEMI